MSTMMNKVEEAVKSTVAASKPKKIVMGGRYVQRATYDLCVREKRGAKEDELVRILCTDAAGDYPVYGMLPGGQVQTFSPNGVYFIGESNSQKDLVEAPAEPERYDYGTKLLVAWKDGSTGLWPLSRLKELRENDNLVSIKLIDIKGIVGEGLDATVPVSY